MAKAPAHMGHAAGTVRSAPAGHAAGRGRGAAVRAVAPRAPNAPDERPMTLQSISEDAWLPTYRADQVPFEGAAETWTPESWRSKEQLQQPTYPSEEALRAATDELAKLPPLVFAGEARTLMSEVARAGRGEGFLLMGGDCAESFLEFSADSIRDTFRVMCQMSVVLNYGGGLPTTKIGRMAGQFAKPRSSPTETVDGVELPSYRGDIINGPEFTEEARVPDPQRLIKCYYQSAATLNLLRAFSKGGYAALGRTAQWEMDFVKGTSQGNAYMDLAARVDQALEFMAACGVSPDSTPSLQTTEFWTAHEACLLEYESAFIRSDSTSGLAYGTSTHLLWCGERTRQLEGAHMEMLRGIANPIGVKVSNKIGDEELVDVCKTLNPNNREGRLTLITRMGAGTLRKELPRLIKVVQDNGLNVTWVCDPCHGNTETSSVGGFKTRRFEAIRQELEEFFEVHEEMGSVPGGMHVEMTGRDVTECTGGGSGVTDESLAENYMTHCDPRLNNSQALELAFLVAGYLRGRRA